MAGNSARINLILVILTSLLFLFTAATNVNVTNTNGFRQLCAKIAKGIRVGRVPQLIIAENNPKIITVQKDGKGNFSTITDAVNSIPSGNNRRTIVKIGPGVYREKVTVNRSKPFITFYGNPQQMPRITFNETADTSGTLASATVAVESNFFVASNIIFENSAPKPVPAIKNAQAVAMRISGDKAAFYNCSFYGHQDTLCDDIGTHFFKDCYIRGTVDFIFGGGRSIYSNCKIESIADGITALTAQTRASAIDNSGFIFFNCSITGSGNAYLSRPWKGNSRVVFAYTNMSSVVNPKGWDDRGRKDKWNLFYGEYKNKGPGAAVGRRANFTKFLTDEEAKLLLSMNFIKALTWLQPPPKF